MTYERKNQNSLSSNEWDRLIDAINKLHRAEAGGPDYEDFVKVHVKAMMSAEGMSWRVHTMLHGSTIMRGINFLAWHRQYLVRFERRLRDFEANVTVPYWDSIDNRSIPGPLDDPALLTKWGISRNWDEDELPRRADWQAARERTTFRAFQRKLEAMHGDTHMAVGGEMETAESPRDPLFWLHHANIDRLWTKWAKDNPGAKPGNLDDELQPPPLMDVKVSKVLKIEDLGYTYA